MTALTEQQIRLECAKLADGDLPLARRYLDFVKQAETEVDQAIRLDSIRIGLVPLDRRGDMEHIAAIYRFIAAQESSEEAHGSA